MSDKGRAPQLDAIKLIHTLVWAFFASCIFMIWYFAWRVDLSRAALAIGIVFVEVLILVLNGWRCPLTAVAARYTDDRRDNFDIYLPAWLARENKRIFGALYLFGILYTLGQWLLA